MIIRDEIEGVTAFLERDVLADRTEVVADVQLARWLNTTEYPKVRRWGHGRSRQSGWAFAQITTRLQ